MQGAFLEKFKHCPERSTDDSVVIRFVRSPLDYARGCVQEALINGETMVRLSASPIVPPYRDIIRIYKDVR